MLTYEQNKHTIVSRFWKKKEVGSKISLNAILWMTFETRGLNFPQFYFSSEKKIENGGSCNNLIGCESLVVDLGLSKI